MAGIRIEFAQFGDFDTFDILRSDSPMNVGSLPSPIATGLTTMYYVDTAVVEGSKYYYRVRVWRDAVSLVSDEISVIAIAYDPAFNIVVSGGLVVDIKGTLTVSGSPAITDDYFIGAVTTPANSLWDWYKKVGALQFLAKGTGVVAQEWSGNLRYKLEISSGVCYLNFYHSLPTENVGISFPVTGLDSAFTKVTLVRIADGSFKAYVDTTEVTISNNSTYNFSGYSSYDTNYIGNASLSLKYLRWYDGIDAIP